MEKYRSFDVDAITPRAFVLDHTGILPALQAEIGNDKPTI
jgi:hypothetical protein